MKTLKTTLITALFFIFLTSCTEQNLDEDNITDDITITIKEVVPIIRGTGHD